MKFAVVLVFIAVQVYLISTEGTESVLEPRPSSTNNPVAVLSRRRRHLDFIKATRVFFRANIKQTVFTWASIWAFAQGYKANNPILNDLGTRPFRRDTYEVVQQMMDLHGFDGQACILNLFCTVTRGPDGEYSAGFLFKLLRHIFKFEEKFRFEERLPSSQLQMTASVASTAR